MTKEEITKYNEKVDYNNSTESWIMDIICCIIFFSNYYIYCV